MHTYLRLIAIFYKNAWLNELEYRMNFWVNSLFSIFWLIWAALSVRIFFFYTDRIEGWSYHELLVVIGIYFTLNGYNQMLLHPNVSRIPEYVRLGTLDHLLTKPINSQFLVSLRNVNIYKGGDVLLGLGLVGYALWQLNRWPSLGQLGLFVVLLLAAAVLLYSFSLILQTLNLWLGNVERSDMLIYALLETGRLPINFYHGWIRQVFTVIIPIALMTTLPAQALLGQLPWRSIAVSVGLAATLFAFGAAFWRSALGYYTSASS